MTWCHVPETDYPSAVGPVDLILALCSPNPDFTPGVGLSLHKSPATQSLQDSEPDISSPPPFGTTSPRLTPDPSRAQSTPYLPDTPASHSATPGTEKGRTTNDTSGPTSNASLKNSGTTIPTKDFNTSSSKTSLDTSALAQRPFCEPYGDWASRLRLASSQRQKSARRMSASDGSAWPTAKALTGGANSQRSARGAGGPDLQEAVKQWPTPMAGTPARNGNSQAGNSDFSRKAEELGQQIWATPAASMPNYDETPETFEARGDALEERGLPRQGVNLGQQAQKMWTTPQAHDRSSRGSGQKPNYHAGNRCLSTDASNWPSPTRRDYRTENSADHIENAPGKKHMDQLPNFVAHGFSHPDQTVATNGQPSSAALQHWHRLYRYVRSSHGRAPARRMASTGKTRLNPIFVEWLMAWPIGHALCACSETEWSRWSRHMRGVLLALPTASDCQWIWAPPPEQQAPEQMSLL